MFKLASKLLGLLPRLSSAQPLLSAAPGCSSQVQASRGLISGCDDGIFNYPRKNKFRRDISKHKIHKKKGGFGEGAFLDKPFQKAEEWDGFGRYKVSSHNYPTHKVNRDVQKRRIIKLHAQERLLINTIRKADILPKDIRRIADKEIHNIPRDSAITRVNRRCAISGRARGIFHQFRMSRMMWRAQADYNKVSGVMLAHWKYNTEIKP